MLLKLYDPILWRSLKVFMSDIRLYREDEDKSK
jgi:hypothetical protein